MIHAEGFRIVRELGAGGMGRVYLAEIEDPTAAHRSLLSPIGQSFSSPTGQPPSSPTEQPPSSPTEQPPSSPTGRPSSSSSGQPPLAAIESLGRGTPVALKVLHPHLLADPKTRLAFHQEAFLGAGIVHPNVVRTFGVAQCLGADRTGAEALVLEYVPGQTVRALLDELGALPEGLCRHIGAKVAAGLSAIHGHGAIHRDIKPENLVLTPGHEVKIMDLGIARLIDQTLAVSRTGQFIGTVRYAAPEQFSHPRVRPTPRLDLFCLGIVLYELASGEHPFPMFDLASYLKHILHDEPVPLDQRVETLSPSFTALVHALLAKSPEHRPSDAEQTRDVLLHGERSSWWHARPVQARAAFSARPLRVGRETSVHGRDDLLRTLDDAFASAHAGSGRVVLLEGEAGVGKTRLVDALLESLSRKGTRLRFLHGGYEPSGSSAPEAPILQAYRELFGEGTRADLEARLSSHPGLIAPLASLLDENLPESAMPRDRLAGALVQLVRSLADENPLVLFIDDLHFATDEGRGLFLSIARAAASSPLFLIGATRPGAPAPWLAELARLSHCAVIPLPRLDGAAVEEILRELLGSTVRAQSLVTFIAQRSDGNPLFVLEMLRALQTNESLFDRTWRPIETDGSGVPPILLPMMRARLGPLEEEERTILEAAACCGFEFDPGLVGEALEIARLPLLRSIARIERKDRLIHAEGMQYVFDHHLIQEALYQDIPPMLRREYHRALATALEGSSETRSSLLDRCRHLVRAGELQAALPLAQDAIEFAQRTHRHPLVIEIATALVQEPDLSKGEERARLLLMLAETHEHLGEPASERAALNDAQIAADSTSETLLRARVRQQLGWLGWRTGELETARTHLLEARELAYAAGSESDEAAVRRLLANIDWSQGRHDDAFAGYEVDLHYAQETADTVREAKAWTNLGNVAFHRGDPETASRYYERSFELSRRAHDETGEGRAGANLAAMKHVLGLHGEARVLYESMLTLAREHADRPLALQVAGNLGGLFCDRGSMAEGLPYLEQAVALSVEMGKREAEGYARANLGLYWLLVGELAAAEEELASALEISKDLDSRRLQMVLALGVARLRGIQGRVDDAIRILEDVFASCAQTEDESNLLEARILGAGILLGLETPPGSRIDREAARRIASMPGRPPEEGPQRVLLHLLEALIGTACGTIDEQAQRARRDMERHREYFSIPSRLRAQIYLFHLTGSALDRDCARELLEQHLGTMPERQRAAACALPLYRRILEPKEMEHYSSH